MFRRKPVVQNETIARQMRQFFRSLDADGPSNVAKSYGEFLWDRATESLANADGLSRSRFNVGLSTRVDGADFEQLTRRAALVSDTLLLCHDWTGEYHDIGESSRKGWDYTPPEHTMGESAYGVAEWLAERNVNMAPGVLIRRGSMACTARISPASEIGSSAWPCTDRRWPRR